MDDFQSRSMRDSVEQAIARYGWCCMSVGPSSECECCAAEARVRAGEIGHVTDGEQRRRQRRQRLEVPFAYTIGLFGLEHPELLVAGMATRPGHLVLGDFVERVRRGETFADGQVVPDARSSHRVRLQRLPRPEGIVLGANRHYGLPPGESVPVLQIVWSGCDGRLPAGRGVPVEQFVAEA